MEPHQNTGREKSHLDSIPESNEIDELIEWTPIESGGANFRTHKLKNIGYHRYIAAPTIGLHLFISVFFLAGTFALVSAYSKWGESMMMFFILLFSGVLGVALAIYMEMKALNPFTIDLDLGVFYRGRSYDPYADGPDDDSGLIRDIHALQVILEHIKSDGSSYSSYEINLVLKDGSRVNVMDHGSRKKIYEDAKQLSDILKVPLWDTSSIYTKDEKQEE